ncbi:MAG: PTS mannitol transporter subunit IICBA [Clostridium sp.]|nr:PTS mannitol transporter subunit IICBA [Clostridium sp.]
MIKERVHNIGKFLSSMIIPNVGIFIAWGLATAIFMPTGWYPNERIAALIDPIIKYLLPILVGYTGGKVAGGVRGGIVASIATIGVIVGANIPMLIGAMIIGPISGYVIKRFDKLIKEKIPVGFEMLVNNFSIAIIGLILAIMGLFIVGPCIVILSQLINQSVEFFIDRSLLPILAIFIEPIKVLFLNNGINHGIIDVVAIDQVNKIGESILYLLEANPGPGLGVILAYWVYSKGAMKESAPGAAIIQLLGGIHEIYFPYILVNPKLIIASIMGSMSSIVVFRALKSGLIATASPGSIFSIIMLSSKGNVIGNLLGVLVGVIVSFLISALFFKRDSLKINKEDNKSSIMEELDIDLDNVNKIVFVCDVGMGSSAMGATKFKNKIKELNLGIDIVNSSVEKIPDDADVVITHKGLLSSVRNYLNKHQFIFIENFLDDKKLDSLYEKLYSKFKKENEVMEVENLNGIQKTKILESSNIILGLSSESKEEAIVRAGELLFEKGYVNCDYIDSMIERENKISTYIGMGIAIPHGTERGKNEVKESGVVILQYPNGISFGGQIAYLIIAVAARGSEHLEILSNIASSLGNIEVLESLKTTNDSKEILRAFNI